MKTNNKPQVGIDSLVLKEEKGLRLKNLVKALPIAVLSTCIAYGVYEFLSDYSNDHNSEQVLVSQVVEGYNPQ